MFEKRDVVGGPIVNSSELGWPLASHWAAHNLAYLIFVISFTQAKFLENEIYTEKHVNYKKRILRQNSVNQDYWDKQ